MGALADKAREQSSFLMLDKGYCTVVKFLSYRFIPSQRDPSVDVVQYKVLEDGKEKYWTNGSSAVMRYMDNIKPGSFIRICRNKSISKDGKEDTTKSTYKVIEVDALDKAVRPDEEFLENKGDKKEGGWDD